MMEEPVAPSLADKEFLLRMERVVNDSIAQQDFSVQDMCDQLFMCHTALFTRMKALWGLGPNEFIRRERLRRAMDLLSKHCYAVSEVSYKVGFSDPKYFSTCFKKQYGISPSQV